MKTLPGQERERFHESPLVFFTASAIIGAGLFAGHFLAWALGRSLWELRRLPSTLGLILVGVGMTVSLLHLGRPARMIYALRRMGQSRLSAEILLASITMAAAAGILVFPPGGTMTVIFGGVLAVSAPALLLSLGWVYRLPGQLAWRGSAVTSPLLLGLAVGILAQAASTADNNLLLIAGFILLGLDAAAFALRGIGMKWDAGSGVPAHPRLFCSRRRIMILRAVDVNLLPAVLLLAESPLAAVCVLTFGIIVDRFSFYALALRQTPEAEIARVNSLLRARSDF